MWYAPGQVGQQAPTFSHYNHFPLSLFWACHYIGMPCSSLQFRDCRSAGTTFFHLKKEQWPTLAICHPYFHLNYCNSILHGTKSSVNLNMSRTQQPVCPQVPVPETIWHKFSSTFTGSRSNKNKFFTKGYFHYNSKVSRFVRQEMVSGGLFGSSLLEVASGDLLKTKRRVRSASDPKSPPKRKWLSFCTSGQYKWPLTRYV